MSKEHIINLQDIHQSKKNAVITYFAGHLVSTKFYRCIMNEKLFTFALLLCSITFAEAQVATVEDDFEGNGTITTWYGDDCGINTNLTNPFQEGINPSTKVLEYHDTGGAFANVGFDLPNSLDLQSNHTFSIKIYVPASGLTGNQPNQVSLKLQDGTLDAPWSTQSEIIKPLSLDQWQIITFDFEDDNYLNLDENSLPPTQRTDFNRIVIQLNGENNNSHILAYLDDFSYNGTIAIDPVFDHLVWSDEFETDGPVNNEFWFHQTQLPNGESWFNGEVQHYTDRIDNAVVENGVLKIIAKKETFTDQGQTKDYTSARLNARFAFQYGKVEIRAKLPSGVGTWPAIWMLGKAVNEDGGYWDNQGFGTTPWPACGEIDTMEHWGSNQNFIQSATHTPSSFGATVNIGGQTVPTASTDFHLYTLTWTSEKLVFSVDQVVHYIYNPAIKDADTWPFDAAQYLLLNVAILPNIAPSFSEGSMEIDYVRVYQESPVSTSELAEGLDSVVYPNPFESYLSIDLDQATDQNILLEIYTSEGKLIKTFRTEISNNKITLSNLDFLSTGVYLLKFEVDHRHHIIKVVKN